MDRHIQTLKGLTVDKAVAERLSVPVKRHTPPFLSVSTLLLRMVCNA